jgi:hypothetical protein
VSVHKPIRDIAVNLLQERSEHMTTITTTTGRIENRVEGGETAPVALEVVLYRLASGVEEARFLAETAWMQQWLEVQPGYLSRELAKSADGLWIDIVTWRTMEAAAQAAEKFGQEPKAQEFGLYVDLAELQMLHFNRQLHLAAPSM